MYSYDTKLQSQPRAINTDSLLYASLNTLEVLGETTKTKISDWQDTP